MTHPITTPSGSPLFGLVLVIALTLWCWIGSGLRPFRWISLIVLLVIISGHPLGNLIAVYISSFAGPFLPLFFVGLGLISCSAVSVGAVAVSRTVTEGGVMTAGSPTMSTAERCSACGRRSVVAGMCSACGASDRHSVQEVAAPLSQLPDVVTSCGTLSTPGVGASEAITIPTQLYPLGRHPITSGRVIGSRSPLAVRGRVLVVRQGSNEPMDFDPWRWVAIPVWGLVLLTSPLAVAIATWQSAGFLVALPVSVGLILVIRFLFSNRLFQSWQFTAALNGRYVVEHMPVAMIRVRQEDDREVQLRLKGRLSGGAVIEGDRISAFGRWRAGVFHTREISCERTGATIIPRQPSAFGLAIAGACVLLSVGLWLCFAGLPWVTAQTETLRNNVEARMPDARSYPSER